MSSPQPQVVVFRGFPISKSYTWSPFVTKVEARLRFDSVPYKVEAGAPPKGPRGKIPYVSLQGEPNIGDSTLITSELVKRGIAHDLNSALAPVDKARDLAIKDLLEGTLYFYMEQEKWVDNYYAMRDHVLAPVPWPLRIAIGILAARGQVATLHGQGTGRFTRAELTAFKTEIWTGVSALLRESKAKAKKTGEPFWVLGGSGPSEADATLFGFINGVLMCAAVPESNGIVRGMPILIDYATAIHDKYFSEYEKWPAA